MDDFAMIRATAHYDDSGKITDIDFSWEGDSRFCAMTPEFIEDFDPQWGDLPSLAEIAIGDLARIGPFNLHVVSIELPFRIVFERWEDSVAELEAIVADLVARRYPGGPPDNLDWGDLYADAYQLQAERAAVGKPCAKCGAPLPPDLLCPCQTYQDLPEETRAQVADVEEPEDEP